MTDSMAHDAHAIAEAVKLGMFMDDAASRGLGMHIEAVGPGYARIAMTVRPDMLNGFKICHGGFITTLADSALRVRLQQLQRSHRRLRHRRGLSGAGARRRSPGGGVSRGRAHRPHRRLRHQGHRPARQGRRRDAGTLAHDQGQAGRSALRRRTMPVQEAVARRPRADRARTARRTAGAAARAPALVAATTPTTTLRTTATTFDAAEVNRPT